MDVFSRQLFCIIYLWAFSALFVATNFCRSHYWKKRFLGKIKYLSSNFNYLLTEKMEYISHESYFFHFPFPLRSCCYCCFYLFQQNKKYQSSLNLLKREQRALYFFQNRNLCMALDLDGEMDQEKEVSMITFYMSLVQNFFVPLTVTDFPLIPLMWLRSKCKWDTKCKQDTKWKYFNIDKWRFTSSMPWYSCSWAWPAEQSVDHCLV